jgi:hypothetical protein
VRSDHVYEYYSKSVNKRDSCPGKPRIVGAGHHSQRPALPATRPAAQQQ